jgi:hypothetical protein
MSVLFADDTAITYWDKHHKGANIFNKKMTDEIWVAAKNANIKLVRLAPDKWQGQSKDFLIGNADDYRGLVPEDLKQLIKVLDTANSHSVKVVITMLSLPGARWKQNNNGQDDNRLWREEKYQDQAIKFWKDLAAQLKNHPAIVGYNILNEPHPEIIFGYTDISEVEPSKLAQQQSKSLVNSSSFYQKTINAIREVDQRTPIILDVGMYADPRSFVYFKPIQDKSVIYSFHMYEPFTYTNKKLNDGRFTYPGLIPLDKNHPKLILVNKQTLQSVYFNPVLNWQKKYNISSARILVGEFGGNRNTNGLDQYFNDLIDIFNEHSWHWLFYSFREDTWDGMDYELGNKPLGAMYWDAVSKGKQPVLHRMDNKIWNVLQMSPQ